jgi:hypothetical protein
MTQTLYAHMNKQKKKERSFKSQVIDIQTRNVQIFVGFLQILQFTVLKMPPQQLSFREVQLWAFPTSFLCGSRGKVNTPITVCVHYVYFVYMNAVYNVTIQM